VVAPLRADEMLFGWLTGGQVPTLWLQDRLYDPGQVHWWDIAIVPVYMSHFIVPMALAVGLWLAAYPLFRRYVWTLVVLTVLTLVTYALYPAAPPWMAGLNGYLPDVGRVTSETLQATGIGTIRSAVERGQAYANAVAAIPSLHSAVPMMVLLFSWSLVGWRVRLLLVAYIAAMTFTLTYGGEHYVVDALIGWVYAAVAVYGVAWVLRRRAGGRENCHRPVGRRPHLERRGGPGRTCRAELLSRPLRRAARHGRLGRPAPALRCRLRRRSRAPAAGAEVATAQSEVGPEAERQTGASRGRPSRARRPRRRRRRARIVGQTWGRSAP
jgi:hypothetical protein